MRVVYISAATDYVYLTVRHLISQREITVKTFFLISFFVNDSKRTVFMCFLIEQENSFGTLIPQHYYKIFFLST